MKEGRGARDEGRGVEMRGARCEERVTFCQLHTAYYSLFAIRCSLFTVHYSLNDTRSTTPIPSSPFVPCSFVMLATLRPYTILLAEFTRG